jgi:dihydrolipoamide dehydrogenase
MHRRSVEVAIIGAGTAGITARRGAIKAGAEDVVLIEGGPHGTTCARVGCMPSKLLVAAANAAHQARTASRFGIGFGALNVDGEAVMRRVQTERDRFANYVVRSMDELPPDRRIDGWARLTGPTTIEVGEHTLIEARAVVIATGTRPWIPPGLRGLGDRVLTNESVFELPTLPRSLAVIGTGAIGLELGQAFHRLGVSTVIFNRSQHLAGLSDPAVMETAHTIFSDELDLRLGVADITGEHRGDGIHLEWTTADGTRRSQEFEYVLAATGRRPDEAHLGLDALELPRDADGGIEVDPATMQVGQLPLFFAGDVSRARAVLHEAADEGRIAGANAATFPRVQAQTRRTPLTITFTDPNVAIVGAPIETLDPHDHAFGEVSYQRQGRARVMWQNRGLVRIWADTECGRLRAAQMMGPRVEHTAHLLAWAIQSGLTVERALEMPFYHPVIEEGIRTALRDLGQKLDCLGRLQVDCTPAA